MRYLLAASCVVWLALGVYLTILLVRVRSLEKEIRDLRDRIRKP